MTNDNSILNLEEIRSGLTILKSKPVQMNIDLTGRCNINPPCVFCDGRAGGYGYGHLDDASLMPHIPFISQCSRITDCSYGEPLMHPQFLQVVKETLERGQAFTFSTNGHLLKQEVSDQLISFGRNFGFSVSLNAASPETYHKLTGKNLSFVLDNIRYFVDKYFTTYNIIPPLALSFIVMSMNKDEVSDFIRLAHALRIPSINFRHLFINPGAKPRGDFGYRFDFNAEILPSLEYPRIEEEAGKIADELGITLTFHWKPGDSAIGQLAEPGINIACLFPWKFLFFQTHTRNIYTCCYSDSALMKLSKGRNLEDAWNCSAIQKMRNDFVKGKIPGYCALHGRYCPLILSVPCDSGILRLGRKLCEVKQLVRRRLLAFYPW
jgi:MoaA/NifB/PqqE/SkfB family radical SAM enzyme